MPLGQESETAKTVELFRQQMGGSTINKDNTTTGYTVATGFQPYNLESGARLLFPVMSPIRNVIPRRKGLGSATKFKAIIGINTTNVSIFAAEGTRGNQPTTEEVDVSVPYVYMGLQDSVSLEADIEARGLINLRATASANLLRSFMQGEEQAILFGQSAGAVTGMSSAGTAVSIGGLSGRPSNPTLSTATSAGATLNTTYFVFITQVTGYGESLANTGPVSQAVTTGNALVITFPAKPAGQAVLYYNAYIGTASGGPFQKIVQASNGQALNITSYTAGAATLPAADGTGSTLAYNGLLAQIAAAATGNTGVNSGSYVSQLNGTLTMAALHTMVKSLWDNARGNPDVLYCNSTEGGKITDLVLPQGSSQPYYLVVNEQKDLMGDYRIGRLVNRVTGGEIRVDTHPFLPQGNLLALSTKLPNWYPGSGIESVFAMDLPLDYTQIDYASTAPSYPFEIRAIGALLLYLPSIHGWLGGITAG